MSEIPNLPDVIRSQRNKGKTIEQIAKALGVSDSTVWRIAKQHNITSPYELRGRWRYKRKGATVAQILAHAHPDRVDALLRKHGYDPQTARRVHRRASDIREHWLLRDPSLRSAS